MIVSDDIIISVVTTAGSVLTVVLPLMRRGYKDQKETLDILKNGIKASLKPQLQQLHDKQSHSIAGKSTSWSEHTDRLFNEVYIEYKALGGNGIIDTIKADMDIWRQKYAGEFYDLNDSKHHKTEREQHNG